MQTFLMDVDEVRVGRREIWEENRNIIRPVEFESLADTGHPIDRIGIGNVREIIGPGLVVAPDRQGIIGVRCENRSLRHPADRQDRADRKCPAGIFQGEISLGLVGCWQRTVPGARLYRDRPDFRGPGPVSNSVTNGG